MSDHSSLVASFKEKLRHGYYYGKSGATNSRYIKENIYFNGTALKESLLNDNECPESQTPKRILFNHINKTYPSNNKCLNLEKGCFIYQNPTRHYNDNDFIHKFMDISLANEFEIANRNYTSALDSETYKLVLCIITNINIIIIVLISIVKID